MSPNQLRIFRFIQAIPAQAAAIRLDPGIPDLKTRILRANLMLEECMETIQEGLGLDIWITSNHDPASQRTINISDVHFEEGILVRPDIIKVADGLSDQEVVNLGTAVVCGIDMQPVFDLVMDNNDLKLTTGKINSLGKLEKAPNHPVPDVGRVLELQIIRHMYGRSESL